MRPEDTEREELHLPVPREFGASEVRFDSSSEVTSEVSIRHKSMLSNLLAGVIYSLISLYLWSNVWLKHPTSTAICGCGDTAKFTWFFGWVAHALNHGLNPFFSTYLYHPHGVNLLADTSSTAVAFVLTPITWTFGPVASLNLALTFSPVLSGLAMFALLRRWCSWTPAAFVGGLVYAFSPFAIVVSASGWVDFTFVAIPPLCVICVDILLFDPRRRAIPTGVVLGLLVTIQFFVGTEVLLMTVLFIAGGLVLLLLFAAFRKPERLRSSYRRVLAGLASAAAVSTGLLAYPTWFALRGPASLHGPVWGGYFEGESSLLHDFWWPIASHLSSTDPVGYQGPYISPQYIGIPCLLVIVGSLIVWHRDLRLWLFATLGATASLISWLHPLGSVPLLQNIIPYRYVLVTYFTLAVMMGLIVEHVRNQVCFGSAGQSDTGTLSATRLMRTRVGGLAAVGVACAALIPIAWEIGQTVPFATQPIVLPTWFEEVAPHLDHREVLLVLPVQYVAGESPQTWQSVGGFTYQMAEEGGPAERYLGPGPLRSGATTLGFASTGIPYFNHVTSADIATTRALLSAWGVTMAVLPDQSGLPDYDRVRSLAVAAAILTASTGSMPTYQSHAWVWKDVAHSQGHPIPSTSAFAACVSGSGHDSPDTVEFVSRCVVMAAG